MSRTFKRASLVAVLATLFCSCSRVKQVVQPISIADLSLEGPPSYTVGTTVAFVSEDRIAIARPERGFFGTLTAVQWTGGRLDVLKTRRVADYRGLGGLFPVGGG